MKTFADAILLAETISTKKEKAEALSGMDVDGQRLLYETENAFRVFGVKKWDEPLVYANVDPSFDMFFTLLDNLANRTLTGNSARNLVTSILEQYTERTASVLARVLKKDLKCGGNVKTFTSVYPGLNIPQFDIMLCAKIEHTKNDKGEIVYPKYKWTFPCYADTKLDGNRLIAIVDNGIVEYLSRSGKPADQWAGVFDEELIKMENEVGQPIVVDGEALSIAGFQATMKAKGSKNDKSGMRFFAFDWMTLTEWKKQQSDFTQMFRTKSLHSLIDTLGLTKIVKTRGKIVNNIAEALAFYTEVTEDGLPGQDEGLIIKQINGMYDWNSNGSRSQVWSKWKPIIDVDVTITGVYEGTKGTKNEGRLGGFTVEGYDENGNHIKSNCGGFKVNSKKFKDWITVFAKEHKIAWAKMIEEGISKDEIFRTYAWNNPDDFIGQMCTIETQELSLAENSDTYSLRFPFFTNLRNDKD